VKDARAVNEGRLSLAGWVYDIETPQALLLVSIQIWKATAIWEMAPVRALANERHGRERGYKATRAARL
jgi:hypothetical protein